MTDLMVVPVSSERKPIPAPAVSLHFLKGFLIGLLLSVLMPLSPKRVGKRWLAIPLPSAIAIGILHLMLFVPWLLIVQAAFLWWNEHALLRAIAWPAALHSTWQTDLSYLKQTPAPLMISQSFAGILAVCLMAAMSFFILLPFAPRPGATPAALKHVQRTAALNLGMLHYWGIIFVAAFIYFGFNRINDQTDINLLPVLVFCAVADLSILAGVRAVDVDYRRPEDLSGPRSPLCDRCGYDLRAFDLDHRCSECGKPVIESIGPQVRLPTAWEKRPTLLNFRVFLKQLIVVVRHSRSLFYRMPVRTGQAAARRWLMISMGLVFVAAFCVPIILHELVPDAIRAAFNEWELYAACFIVASIWTALALMMVGIETGGVTLAGRMRGRPVEIAAASKVTAYAGILMLFWILMGTLQLLPMAYLFAHSNVIQVTVFGHSYRWTPHLVRLRDILGTASLFVFHVGGLLWFELTVYRGLRAVQYANR